MRTNRGSLFRACKGNDYHHLHLSDSEAGNRAIKLYSGTKGRALGVFFLELLAWGNHRGTCRSESSYLVSMKNILGFLWLVLC
jgi:hypothetical protein